MKPHRDRRMLPFCWTSISDYRKLNLTTKHKKAKRSNAMFTTTMGVLLLLVGTTSHNCRPVAGLVSNQQAVASPSGAATSLAGAPQSQQLPAQMSQQTAAPATSLTQQPHSAVHKQQEPIGINLIPVDQPIAPSESKSDQTTLAVSGGGMMSQPEERQSESEPFDSGVGAQGQTLEGAQKQMEDISEQQQQVVSQFYADQSPMEQQHQQQQQQQAMSSAEQSVVERRFGLFKKGHGGGAQQMPFGQPLMMSSNYLQAPNLFGATDCERCLASLQQSSGPSTFGEYQSIDTPTLPVPAPPPPPSMVQPQAQLVPMGSSFSPIKSKLFMKFPFFIKPSGGLSSLVQHHQQQPFGSHQAMSWPLVGGYQQHASQLVPTQRPLSGALYLRQQPPSYNCIQTHPPLLAAAASSTSSQSADLLAPPHSAASKDGHRYHQHHLQSPASGTKHFSSAAQQQQQQLSSYARR